MEEFKVSECITLKLEKGKTNTYVKGEFFNHCKSLLLSIAREDIEFIDEVSERIGFLLEESIEEYIEPENRELLNSITPEMEYWVHCSNLQVWAEQEYDTRLIHFHYLEAYGCRRSFSSKEA